MGCAVCKLKTHPVPGGADQRVALRAEAQLRYSIRGRVGDLRLLRGWGMGSRVRVRARARVRVHVRVHACAWVPLHRRFRIPPQAPALPAAWTSRCQGRSANSL